MNIQQSQDVDIPSAEKEVRMRRRMIARLCCLRIILNEKKIKNDFFTSQKFFSCVFY